MLVKKISYYVCNWVYNDVPIVAGTYDLVPCVLYRHTEHYTVYRAGERTGGFNMGWQIQTYILVSLNHAKRCRDKVILLLKMFVKLFIDWTVQNVQIKYFGMDDIRTI